MIFGSISPSSNAVGSRVLVSISFMLGEREVLCKVDSMSWGKKHSDTSEASYCQTLRMLSNGRGSTEIKG